MVKGSLGCKTSVLRTFKSYDYDYDYGDYDYDYDY